MSAGLALIVGILFIVGFKSYAVKKIRTF